MEKFSSKVGLGAFRRDALHRHAMCAAFATDDARFGGVLESAGRSLAELDEKATEVRSAQDVLVRARALERVRKLRAVAEYAQARREIAVEAEKLVPVLLKKSPSDLRKTGIKGVLEVFRTTMALLRRPETPESIRTEQLPDLERVYAQLDEADKAEDTEQANLASLQAALHLFKSERQAERLSQYADLLKLFPDRAPVEEFFLTAYEPNDDAPAPAEPAPAPPAGA